MVDQNAAAAAPVTPPKEPVRVAATAPTRPTSQADLSPHERWQNDQNDRTRGDPWLDTSKVLTRDAAGNLVQRERVVGPDGEPTVGKPVDQQDPNADRPPAAAEGEAEKFKVGEHEITAAELSELMQQKAAADSRAAQVPKTAGEYKLELSKDLVLPDGVQFKVASPDDPVKGPMFAAARDWAHKNNLTQGQFSELLGLYASTTAHEQIMINKAAVAERAKLGVSGGARVDAVALFLRGRYGETAARPMINTLVTEAQVRIWEDVITRSTNGGGGSFSQRGRDMEPQGISDEAYNKMSYSQKVDYAREASARAANSGRR
jgi:hypothetical protein